MTRARVCTHNNVHLIVSRVAVSAFADRRAVFVHGVFTDTIIIAIDDDGGDEGGRGGLGGGPHRITTHRRTSSQTAEQILGTESSSITLLLLRCKWPGRDTSLQ